MAEDDGLPKVLPKWKPKPLHRAELSKRRAKQQADPWSEAGRYPQATTHELDAIIHEMRIGEPPQEVKSTLLVNLNILFNVADGARRLQQMASASEKKELLKGFLGNVGRVLNSLGLDDHSAEEIYNSDSFSQAMNPTLRQCLADASPYEHWIAFHHVARLVRAVAQLGVIADRALAQVDTIASIKSSSPQQMISRCMAQMYYVAFGQRPTLAEGSPWLKFLRWGLKKTGFPTSSDGALRKLPILQHPPAGCLSQSEWDKIP